MAMTISIIIIIIIIIIIYIVCYDPLQTTWVRNI